MKKQPDNKETSLTRSSAVEYLTFVAAQGQGGVEVVYADEDIWLTQKMMGVLYDVNVRTINEHLKKLFSDRELQEDSVIRKFRITASDGKNYNTQHYNLSAIIAVGYKVNSERAVQFRKWATTVVKEYTIKGFAMDDERLKAGGTVLTKQYFEEQLQRVREIRLSERKFYQKITDIYATAIDYGVGGLGEMVAIDGKTIELIKNKSGGDGTKVINLIKSIEKQAEEDSDDPYLIAMAERARAVQEKFEDRQTSTAEALAELLRELESNETRKKEQAEKSFDGLTYFIYRSLLDAKIQNAEAVSQKIRQAFTEFPNWKRSENAVRELRKKVTFAIFAETDNLDQVTAMVDDLFKLLEKASRI